MIYASIYAVEALKNIKNHIGLRKKNSRPTIFFLHFLCVGKPNVEFGYKKTGGLSQKETLRMS